MAEPTLLDAIATCIDQHGRCVVICHPEDAGQVRTDAPTQAALLRLMADGVLETMENRYLERGKVVVMAKKDPLSWSPSI